jgi:hypothetical protein
VAGRDRLRGLAQAHVIGEEQPAAGQEARHALALVREQLVLQAREVAGHLARRHRRVGPRELVALGAQERRQGRLGGPRVAALDPREQGLDGRAARGAIARGERETSEPRAAGLGCGGEQRDDARGRRSARRRGTRLPADAIEPVTRTRERSHRIPAQPRPVLALRRRGGRRPCDVGGWPSLGAGATRR